MHQSSYEKMSKFKEQFLSEGTPLRILDVGSQDVNGSYRPIFEQLKWSYTGADMVAGANVDIVLDDAYSWNEIKSNSVDVLVSGQVLEHVEFFWITMLEIYRVLKPGGICCILVPSSGPEHRYPVDCWRFYPDGLSALAKNSQFNIVKVSTQWDSSGYADGSDQWHDSMLVCRKPEFSPYVAIKARLKNRIQHRIFSWFS